MIHQGDFILTAELRGRVSKQGFDIFGADPEIIDAAMQVERQNLFDFS